MKGMELSFAAKKIAEGHIRKNKSMVSGIVKLAQDRGLNDEQIKRLIEESNKEAFMMGFEKDGSQVFDVASFDEVKAEMAGKMEKVANIEIRIAAYSDEKYRELLGDWKPPVLEKVASEEPTESEIVCKALIKLAFDYGEISKEIQRLSSLGYHRYNQSDENVIIKIASTHKDNDFADFENLLKQASVLEKEYNYIFEKYSGIDGFVLKGIGKTIAGTANVVGSLGATVAKPVASAVAKNPGTALGAALIVPVTASNIKNHKNTKALVSSHYTGPIADSLHKTAGINEGLQHTLDLIAGAASGFGPLSGLLGAAAKKLGGGIALTMNQKEFDRSFDTIISRNPDLQDRKGQIREYFDVITRHSPTIAKDPIVAENMVRNFDAFGGIDFNTIKAMNEMEAKKAGVSKDRVSPLSFG